MQPEQPSAQRSFFTELLASMSDLKFSQDGRHMLARDFMGLKLWDVRSEAAPVAAFPIHEHLKGKVGAKICNCQKPEKYELLFPSSEHTFGALWAKPMLWSNRLKHSCRWTDARDGG